MNQPIDVNFARPQGRIRPLHGINFGPRYTNGVDLSARFREAGFPNFRLHDCPLHSRDTVDIHSLFPLFHADETDPANWNFGPTDDYLAAIAALGGDIIYRLGETIEHQKPKYYVHPPPDFDKWARICIQIIRHYNEGWANGFHYGIRYWEIWNEPWNPALWSGTAEQFHRLYEVTSKAIKKQFPRLQVGGVSILGPYANDCLDYFKRHDCPIDFLSWNPYARTVKEIVGALRDTDKYLKEQGFNSTKQMLNEWNWFPEKDWDWTRDPERARRFHERIGSAESAAFVVNFLSFMQDEAVHMASWYAPFLGMWGMFDAFQKPLKPYYAMVAFNRLLATPCRVQASGADLDKGLSVLAGVDVARGRAAVLLANFGDLERTQARVALNHLPVGTWQCEELSLDETTDLQPVRSVCMDAASAPPLDLALPPASVRLLTMELQGVAADDREGGKPC